MQPNSNIQPNTVKLCECGCGQPTRIARWFDIRHGAVPGKPMRFIKGHSKRVDPSRMTEPNPGGLCMCGCGEPAPISRVTLFKKGLIKGKPLRFIPGHQNRIRLTQVESHFWESVERKGENDCWNWIGKSIVDGYGTLTTRGKYVRAHRFAWEITNGPIPKGMQVCHRCDNRLCVNPKHLFLGTAVDNQHDKVVKKRQARGERSGNAKLTNDEVREIRSLFSIGKSQSQIARDFNVTVQSIHAIVHHKTWKHIE